MYCQHFSKCAYVTNKTIYVVRIYLKSDTICSDNRIIRWRKKMVRLIVHVLFSMCSCSAQYSIKVTWLLTSFYIWTNDIYHKIFEQASRYLKRFRMHTENTILTYVDAHSFLSHFARVARVLCNWDWKWERKMRKLIRSHFCTVAWACTCSFIIYIFYLMFHCLNQTHIYALFFWDWLQKLFSLLLGHLTNETNNIQCTEFESSWIKMNIYFSLFLRTICNCWLFSHGNKLFVY